MTPMQNRELAMEIARGHVKAAMLTACSDYGEETKSLAIKLKPAIGVFATQAHQKHKLHLVAATPTVTALKDDKSLPVGAVSFGAVTVSGTSVTFYGSRCFAPPKPVTQSSGHVPRSVADPFVAPFWLVGSTTKRDDATVALSSVSVSVGCTSRDVNSVCKIAVPIFVNTKPLVKGDELLYYKESATQPLSMTPVAPKRSITPPPEPNAKKGKGKGRGKGK